MSEINDIIKRRGRKGWARFQPGPDDPMKYKIPNPKSTPKEIVGSHGHRPHGKSILWPALYEHLRRKGKTKAAAAAISNAAWKKKRMGIPTNTPMSVRGIVKEYGMCRHGIAKKDCKVCSTIEKMMPTGQDMHVPAPLGSRKKKRKKDDDSEVMMYGTPGGPK